MSAHIFVTTNYSQIIASKKHNNIDENDFIFALVESVDSVTRQLFFKNMPHLFMCFIIGASRNGMG